MAEVTNLDDYRPHGAGEAKCLACGYEWVAVAPTGTLQLECSECGLMKGVFKGLYYPSKDDEIWVCNCGNDLFVIAKRGIICTKCGTWQVFD